MASAAILVGGDARRFGGRDKSALVVEGRTVLDRQLGELRQITDDILLVASSADPGWTVSRRAGVRVIEDRVVHAGPLGGLDAALAAAQDDRLLLLACDMPFVTAPFLRFLLAQADGVEAVVPRTDRGYHPLCAVYARSCRGAVAERLMHGELALTGLLQGIRVRVVEGAELLPYGPSARLLANLNTPQDYEALEALLDHEP
jgi:molybdopterin-guanine dinucleotide biosynthesis protein A